MEKKDAEKERERESIFSRILEKGKKGIRGLVRTPIEYNADPRFQETRKGKKKEKENENEL